MSSTKWDSKLRECIGEYNVAAVKAQQRVYRDAILQDQARGSGDKVCGRHRDMWWRRSALGQERQEVRRRLRANVLRPIPRWKAKFCLNGSTACDDNSSYSHTGSKTITQRP